MTEETGAGAQRAVYMKSGFNVNTGDVLTFNYRNWRGEFATDRRCRVLSVVWGSTEWHPQEAWLLRGHDLIKDEERMYAMSHMYDVRHV